MGVNEILIEPSKLKPLHDDQIYSYYDQATGIKLATVGAGTWYNTGLFLYLLKKN